MIIVRYADDFVMGFQHRYEAEQFLKELRERMQKFGLALHPEKTCLFECEIQLMAIWTNFSIT